MKKLLFLFAAFSFCSLLNAQSPGCAGAVDLNVMNVQGAGSPEDTAIDYGCVTAAGQYIWYGYFTVCQGGSLNVAGGMNTSAVDADITVWGPFPNTVNLCPQLTAGTIAGCGASAGTDIINFSSGVLTGEVYMVAIACDTNTNVPVFAHSGTAMINSTCVPPPPCSPVNGYEMLCVVTVDSATQEYQLIWNEIAGNPATHFGIMKEDFMGVPQQIDTVHITSLSQYIDTGADPNVHTERYSLVTYDTCNTSWSAVGVYIQPMFCQSSLSTQGTVNVAWSPYVDIAGNGPVYYVIYRGATPATMVSIDTVATFVGNYTDINPLIGTSYYKIGVALNNACVPMRLQQNASASVVPVASFSNASPITVVGITENSLQEVSLYPNPSEGIFTVRNLTGVAVLHVYDLSGRAVVQQQLQPNASQQINLCGIEAGVYSVTIENETGFYREEMVISR